MAREYDHLFKLLIIGDSGEWAVDGGSGGRVCGVVVVCKAWSLAD